MYQINNSLNADGHDIKQTETFTCGLSMTSVGMCDWGSLKRIERARGHAENYVPVVSLPLLQFATGCICDIVTQNHKVQN